MAMSKYTREERELKRDLEKVDTEITYWKKKRVEIEKKLEGKYRVPPKKGSTLSQMKASKKYLGKKK